MNFFDAGALPAALLALVFKSLAVALAAVTLTRFVLSSPRAGASARHLVWLCAILGLLFLPLTSLVLTGLQTPIPPVLSLPVSASSRSAHAASLHIAKPPRDGESASSQTPGPSAAELMATGDTNDTGPRSAPPSVVANVSVGIVFGAAWLTGTMLLLMRLLVSLRTVRQQCRRDYAELAPDSAPVEVLSQVREKMGIRQGVSVRIAQGKTPLPPVPMTMGLLHSVILLPASAAQWPPDLLYAVLCHEMAHIRRSDWLWQLCAEAVAAAYWWNPLVWLAARNLRSESEECCDDLVVASGMSPSEYAAHLVHIVEILRNATRHGRILTVVSMAEKPEISRRVEAVLWENKRRHALSRKAVAAGVLVACALFLPLAALRSANPAETAGHRANFPGMGIRAVEVNSVTYKGPLTPVWSPDGTALSASKTQVPDTIRRGTRVFKITLSGLSESDHAVFSTDDTPAYVRGIGHVVGGTYNPSTKSRVYTMTTAPVEGKTTTSIEVKLASGSWKTLHSWLPGAVSPPGALNLRPVNGYGRPVDDVRLRYGKPKQAGHDTLLPCLNNGPMQVDWRVTAILHNGASVSSRDRNASRKGDEGESQPAVISGKVLFPGVRLADIVEFEFQVRPYQFVTLQNIALYPNPDANVVKRISDSVILPNGATVEVVGVTNAKVTAAEANGPSRKLWWDMQGRPLASGPFPARELVRGKTYYSPGERPSLPKQVAAAIRVTGATEDKQVTFTSVPPASRTSWASGGNMGVNFYTVWADAAEGQTTGSLRVGVSSGKWNDKADWGVSLYRGSKRGASGTRTFSYNKREDSIVYREPTQVGKDANLIISHNLQEADWRIVAVLKDGRTVVGSDESAAKSSVTLGDLLFPNVNIKSIALFKFQTRDYQYANFKSIALNAQPFGE